MSNERWAELAHSDNPFAVVVMAHLKAQATSGDPAERLRWKRYLFRGLYERNLGRDDILGLLRLIDWMLALPEGLEHQFRDTVAELEKEHEMPYVTSIERLARKEGKEEGLREALLATLEERFGAVPPRWSRRCSR